MQEDNTELKEIFFRVHLKDETILRKRLVYQFMSWSCLPEIEVQKRIESLLFSGFIKELKFKKDSWLWLNIDNLDVKDMFKKREQKMLNF